MRTAASICLLLVLGIALDSSRPAAEVNTLSHGTGFFVSKDGQLLTNFHVIDSCRQLTVQSGRLSGTARVVATDAANDLALLATNLKPVRIADWRYSVHDDEPVVAYGFPRAGERAANGKALGLTGWRHNKLLFAEAGVEPGMSGSAIMDGSGHVIGILTGHSSYVMGRGTGSTAAAALLGAHGVPHPEAREATPLSKSDIIGRGKAISVKVTCQEDSPSTDGSECGIAFVPDDKMIEACNREIASGRINGERLREMYTQRAASHLNERYIDLALRDCDEAAKIGEDGDNFRCRARIYFVMRAYSRAITELDEAIRLFPKDMIALSRRGASFLATNDLPHAMADLNKVIEIDPEFANALRLRGAVYDKIRQHDLAVADFDRAIAIYDKLLKLYSAPLLRVDLLAERANAYDTKGERDRAIADYDEAIRLNPKNARAFNNRGIAYRAKGDNDRAIADYDEAIRLNPRYAAAFNNRAVAYRAKGGNDRAIADYDEAIRLDPRYAAAFNNRGVAYRAKADNDRAIADYDEAIRLDPEYAQAYNNRCYTLAIVGQVQQALADCNESLQLRPNDAATLDSRGFTYLKLGQFDSAIADYDSVLKLKPKMASSLYGRGVAKLKKGDTDSGNSDIAAARAIQADIVEEYTRYGVK